MNKITELPLFPLGLILFPQEKLPLHIFEPRYKEMIYNKLNYNQPFGIVLNEKNKIFNIGCIVEINKVIKVYSDNRYDIIVKGNNRFEIEETFMKSETIIGKIKILEDKKSTNKALIDEIHDNYLKILLKNGNSNIIDKDLRKQLSFEFVQNILLPLSIKKKLIGTNSEDERIKIINTIFSKFNSLSKEDFKQCNAKA